MATTVTTLTVSRTLLSLPTLDLQSSPYRVGADGQRLELGGSLWELEYAASPFLHGSQLVGGHKKQTTGCIIDVDIVGATQAAIKTARLALVAAFEQFSYTLTVGLDGTNEVFSCDPADSVVGYLAPASIYGLVQPVALLFNRQPVVT